MSFSPDRTANLRPRTCPSSSNHARRRLRSRWGRPPLSVADATFTGRLADRRRWAGRSAFIPSTTKYTTNTESTGALRRAVADLSAPACGRSRLRSGTKNSARDASN